MSFYGIIFANIMHYLYLLYKNSIFPLFGSFPALHASSTSFLPLSFLKWCSNLGMSLWFLNFYVPFLGGDQHSCRSCRSLCICSDREPAKSSRQQRRWYDLYLDSCQWRPVGIYSLTEFMCLILRSSTFSVFLQNPTFNSVYGVANNVDASKGTLTIQIPAVPSK